MPSALSKLPTDARQACVALSTETPWPAEEWAIAVRKLVRALLPSEELGFTTLIRLVLATGAAPTEIADRMISEFQAARKVAADPLGSVLPTTD
jgi:hypothetical protein